MIGGSRWFVALARLGFAMRGVVYLGIGLVGLAVALGVTERPRSALGVVRLISRLPLGDVMSMTLAAGLAGYAALNFAGAWRDPFDYGAGLRGWVLRGADAVSGAIYLALAAAIVRLLAEPGTRSAQVAVDWAARVLGLPLGAVWLAGIGVAVTAAGVFLVRKATLSTYDTKLDRRALGEPVRCWISRLARLGTLARAAVFIVCGSSVIQAARHGEPARVATVTGGLEALGAGVLGPFVLGFISVGFAGYGAYQVVKTRHRRMDFTR